VIAVGTAKPSAAQTPAPTAPSAPPAPAAAPVPPRATVGTAPGAAPRNIRFDITINDSGVTAPINKTVTLNVSQGGNGSIRSSAKVPGAPVPAPRTVTSQGSDGKPQTTTTPGTPPSISLNVDVSNPTVFDDGGIRAMVVIEYQPYVAASATRPEPAVVRANSISVFESGRKMVLLQAADPMSDRRTTIEVTATIVK
jgi:hypothetical protein